MAYLREAVEKQKAYLIEQLVNHGHATNDGEELFNMTLSELINEYDQLLVTVEKSDKNTIRFTRSIQLADDPQIH
ncbi:Fur-regulated basic protein FbpA [Aquibacillus kalidii]|uniref:Fur-regulated basic protein FbpA n=1 Tax=Aquibacillus kalidii TaxID=2762597 RepID=UPI001644A86B|nr:Fur-regulated basic protein FbpA [Aquibacillus kalidii]